MGRKTEQHLYVTDEKWKLVNNENIKLYKEFIDYCKTEDKAPDTIRVYDSNLKIFLVWLLDYANNKFFIELKKRDVMQFQNWMVNTMNLSPSRVRHLKSAVSSLSNFVVDILDDEYPNFKNIINKIKPPVKQETREKTVLSDEQIDKLLNILVEKKQYVKACFVACLAGSGVRKSEIIQFKASFFNEDKIAEDYYITDAIRCKGRGKIGKKKPKNVIKDIVDPYLKLWLEERKNLEINCDELFVIKRNGQWKPITKDTVDSWMESFSKLIDEDCYCHCFRHYAATWLKKNGVELDKIRDFLGHESSETTKIYIDIGTEENLKGMLSFMKKDKKEENSNVDNKDISNQ